METIGTIKDVLSENLGTKSEEITEDTTFEALDIDSLDMTELICELEERFDIDFGEPESLETVGQLAEYVDSLKAQV